MQKNIIEPDKDGFYFLDFDWAVKNMADQTIGNAGQNLAPVLESTSVEGVDALKSTDWAEKLYANKPIKLDESDRSKLEKFMTEQPSRIWRPIFSRRFGEFWKRVKTK